MGANVIQLNPQAGDQITILTVASAYNQPSAFQPNGFTVYTFASIPGYAANALVGKGLTFSGFANAKNNGTFQVLSSTATSVTVNNAFGVVAGSGGFAAFQTQSFPTQYASLNTNLWSNQNGDHAISNAKAGDTLVAVVIGLKQIVNFDQLHGESPAFGYLAGLNDYNANPEISDNSAISSGSVTSAEIVKNTFVLSEANGTATITHTAVVSDVSSAATAAQVTSNVLTVTAANDFLVGEVVTLSGFTAAGNLFLNGLTVTVLSSPGPGTSFTAALTHANVGPTVETTGIATGRLLEVTYTGATGEAIAAGQTAYLEGTQHSDLNGQTFTILSAASPFKANTTIVPYSSVVDTGTFLTGNTNGTAVYQGTGLTGLAGYYVTIAGFAHSQNNGTYLVNSSTSTSITVANGNGGIGETAVASAVDFVLTLAGTGFGSFSAGTVLALSGFVNAHFLNGQQITVVTETGGTSLTANYPEYTENYLVTGSVTAPGLEPTPSTAVATTLGGNTWTLVAQSNIIDSDYTPISTPPTAPNPYPSSKWNIDGYYPSIYIYVASGIVLPSAVTVHEVISPPNVNPPVTVTYTYTPPLTINLNSMYQLGIDPPQDWSSGAVPIFDGGVNLQVYCFSGAASTVDGHSISTTETLSNPATAPASLTVAGADGDLLFSVGLLKSGNVFQAGSIGGTAVSIASSAVTPLVVSGSSGQYPSQNYGGAIYTIASTAAFANNGAVGYIFTATGFGSTLNDGVFTCTASTATSLTLNNGGALLATAQTGHVAYTQPMIEIGNGMLVGSEAHYMVEYALVPSTAGTVNPGFENPLGYPMLVASIAVQSN